jgi:protein SCO1/2
VLSPPRPAPPLALRDYLGRQVNIASYRGKAVLVTFLYTHCPDVCPLIVGRLRVVQNALGAQARRLQILAISVDPKGDTPQAVRKFLRAQDMDDHMRWLIGTRAQLQRTWHAWGVGVAKDPKSAELVEHSAPIFGISASGKRMTVYSTSFKRTQLVHDVPLLAAR